MNDGLVRCAHQFRRVRRWPVKLRWRCDRCDLLTHHYDAVDRRMSRPIHRFMSVAMSGVNTVKE